MRSDRDEAPRAGDGGGGGGGASLRTAPRDVYIGNQPGGWAHCPRGVRVPCPVRQSVLAESMVCVVRVRGRMGVSSVPFFALGRDRAVRVHVCFL